jgi:hypothetical protein
VLGVPRFRLGERIGALHQLRAQLGRFGLERRDPLLRFELASPLGHLELALAISLRRFELPLPRDGRGKLARESIGACASLELRRFRALEICDAALGERPHALAQLVVRASQDEQLFALAGQCGRERLHLMRETLGAASAVRQLGLERSDALRARFQSALQLGGSRVALAHFAIEIVEQRVEYTPPCLERLQGFEPRGRVQSRLAQLQLGARVSPLTLGQPSLEGSAARLA